MNCPESNISNMKSVLFITPVNTDTAYLDFVKMVAINRL